MPLPNKLPKLNFDGVDPVFQQWLNQLTDAVNTHSGYNGVIQLADHLDLNGNRIQNLGEPVSESDAIAIGVAQKKYSAAALKPQLEAGSAQPLSTYRQVNNPAQREQVSSFLNDLMSTPPSANNIQPTVTNLVGSVQVSIPASIFRFADGSTLSLTARTDILSLPTSYAITGLSVSAGVVTVNCAASGLVAGEIATIVPGTNATFAGTFALTSSSGGGSVLEYQSGSASGTDSSGSVEINGVYYYSITRRRNYLRLSGPYSADTGQNRLDVNVDGYQIVAVVTVTSSGAQIALSGGGGTPIVGSPTAGTFF